MAIGYRILVILFFVIKFVLGRNFLDQALTDMNSCTPENSIVEMLCGYAVSDCLLWMHCLSGPLYSMN